MRHLHSNLLRLSVLLLAFLMILSSCGSAGDEQETRKGSSTGKSETSAETSAETDEGTTPVTPIERPDSYHSTADGKFFIPEEHYPSDDLIVCAGSVTDFGAVGDGVTDNTSAFQKAINRVAAMGGGILYIPAGRYYLPRRLNLPQTLTLCGDWVDPETEPAGTSGTVILTDYSPQGTDPSKAFITMKTSSGLRNLTLLFTNRDPADPVPAPPAISVTDVSQVTVENVTILGATTGISFGEGKTTNSSLSSITNVYISALEEGVVLNNTYDCTRVENLHVSPRYWAENVIRPMSDTERETLEAYVFGHCTGITLYRGDATGLYGTFLEGLSTGIHLDKDPNGNGVTSGSITYTRILNCDVGLQVDGAHGIGTALVGFDARANRPCTAAVRTGSAYKENIKIEEGRIVGNFTNAALLTGPCALTLTLMNVELQDPANTLFSVRSGGLSCCQCHFRGTSLATDAGGSAKFGFYGCTIPQDAQTALTSSSVLVRNDEDLELRSVRNYHLYRESKPMPSGYNLMSITEFGAKADGKTDCTKAIQSTLDAVAAAGGGVALIPHGKFIVKGCLTVPSGVELSGLLGVWCYNASAMSNSCLLLYAGQDDPDGQAAISLSEGSGVRGFLGWYPEQDYTSYIPYSYTIRAMGPNCYAVGINISNAYQYMDFGTHESTGHYLRNCAGCCILQGLFIGNNPGEGWVENIHLNQHQPYELSLQGQEGGYKPEMFEEVVFDGLIYVCKSYIFGYNANEHVLSTFSLGAHTVYTFIEQDGKSTSGTFVQCGADGCRHSIEIEQAYTLTFISPGNVSLGDDDTRTYLTAYDTFTGMADIHGGAGFGNPNSDVTVEGGEVSLYGFTFASATQAVPVTVKKDAHVELFGCIMPYAGGNTKVVRASGFTGTVRETGTLQLRSDGQGYNLFSMSS